MTGPGLAESFLVLIMNYSDGYLIKVKLTSTDLVEFDQF